MHMVDTDLFETLHIAEPFESGPSEFHVQPLPLS